ncbi:MAG TPA: beta-N-acetylhexosaminidase [Stellaceae bacterium]|nr:beta-N-acetylhexosaminidase [Stellaceae bacterium]
MRSREPGAVIFGCAGRSLSAEERAFFRDADPLGFILFKRNCESPDQVRALVRELRATVDRSEAPVLIDQEGGRVARLQPPHWRRYPAPATLGALGGERAREAVRLVARLIAADLAALGITVDCLPVLDVPQPGADPVIGDRAYSGDPAEVARLGQAACEGLLEGGVLPVIKHIPGHGRAGVDSHHALPRVTASRAELDATDFAPFRALASMPWAMTAHIVYTGVDSAAPATLSPLVIHEVIRGSMRFDGVLVSDDLSMNALGGSIGARAARALAAGCDLALHCNGDPAEMAAVAASVTPLTPEARRRLDRAEARRSAPAPLDRRAAEARLDALLGGAAA